MAAQSRHVRSIEKAIVLLDCFWAQRRALSLVELSEMTGWAKSTIHGLLASMMDSAVVEQNAADGKYRLGYHLFELGSCVNLCWDVVTLAKPRLLQIVATMNESAYLARLSGQELLLAQCTEPHNGFRVSNEPGSRIPLHCTSQGKAILAHLSETEAKALVVAKGMRPYTQNTVTTWEALQPQLALTRELGYAVERGEFRAGLQSVAAPIFDHRGKCEYAIGIVGAQKTPTADVDPKAAELVRAAAQAVSYDMGWRG